ncbi:MAG: hypothetical protein RL641_941 [Candidatus Parcubacteria bacterium]|jgi:hypothetical protein
MRKNIKLAGIIIGAILVFAIISSAVKNNIASIQSGRLVAGTASTTVKVQDQATSVKLNQLASICSNGIDDDGDGFVDFPADPGCASTTDPNEIDVITVAQCSDGIDNDQDGFIDYPADLDCTSPIDTSEASGYICSDGIDNDGDGLVDFPADPGCSGPTDQDESNVTTSCIGSVNITPNTSWVPVTAFLNNLAATGATVNSFKVKNATNCTAKIIGLRFDKMSTTGSAPSFTVDVYRSAQSLPLAKVPWVMYGDFAVAYVNQNAMSPAQILSPGQTAIYNIKIDGHYTTNAGYYGTGTGDSFAIGLGGFSVVDQNTGTALNWTNPANGVFWGPTIVIANQ